MSDQPKAPYPGSYWVVPGSLLAGAYPGGHDEVSTDARLAAVLSSGITSVINLMQEEEIHEHAPGVHYLPYADRLEALGESQGRIVEIAGYAMEPGTTPSDQEMALILDAVDAEIDGRNSPTLVHGAEGHARTGMVVGCYLARHGIAVGKQAVEKVRELRATDPLLAAHKSPTAMIEERFILRWREGQ